MPEFEGARNQREQRTAGFVETRQNGGMDPESGFGRTGELRRPGDGERSGEYLAGEFRPGGEVRCGSRSMRQSGGDRRGGLFGFGEEKKGFNTPAVTSDHEQPRSTAHEKYGHRGEGRFFLEILILIWF